MGRGPEQLRRPGLACPSHPAMPWCQLFLPRSHLLPGGEKRLPAMNGLGEGAAEVDDAPLSTMAALHHHAGHLNQLHGALPVTQGLSEI